MKTILLLASVLIMGFVTESRPRKGDGWEILDNTAPETVDLAKKSLTIVNKKAKTTRELVSVVFAFTVDKKTGGKVYDMVLDTCPNATSKPVDCETCRIIFLLKSAESPIEMKRAGCGGCTYEYYTVF